MSQTRELGLSYFRFIQRFIVLNNLFKRRCCHEKISKENLSKTDKYSRR